jgi:hypothetical protein
MTVAANLGVDDINGAILTAARRAWPGWCAAAPELAVVDELLDLRSWADSASSTETNTVFARLAHLANEQTAAAGVLAWLLSPGAARLARSLRNLSPDVDALIAGQLWLEIRSHSRTATKAIAWTILRKTRTAVLAEMGLGDDAHQAWANTTVTDQIDHIEQPTHHNSAEPDISTILKRLVQQMLDDGALTLHEIRLASTAADGADTLGIARRSLGGITAAKSFDLLTMLSSKSTRTIRRRLETILKKMARYARHNFDPHDHTTHVDGDDDLDFDEYLMTVGNPTMLHALKNWRTHHQLVGRCPKLGLIETTITEDQCSCAPLKTGCLIKTPQPTSEHHHGR